MSRVRIHNFSISLDGFATGEGQALDAPFGHAGHRLHEWIFATRFGRREILGESGGTEGVDHVMADRHGPRIGTEIMGAGKFGPPGWQDDPEWRGWWGDNPPFHTPTYVLTHRARPSLEMEGGTTFHFLDAPPAEALEVARAAADGQDVRIGGGPTTVRAFLAAGLVDHLHVVQVPILLGRGVRLWDDLTAERRGHSCTRNCGHVREASPIASSASKIPARHQAARLPRRLRGDCFGGRRSIRSAWGRVRTEAARPMRYPADRSTHHRRADASARCPSPCSRTTDGWRALDGLPTQVLRLIP